MEQAEAPTGIPLGWRLRRFCGRVIDVIGFAALLPEVAR